MKYLSALLLITMYNNYALANGDYIVYRGVFFVLLAVQLIITYIDYKKNGRSKKGAMLLLVLFGVIVEISIRIITGFQISRLLINTYVLIIFIISLYLLPWLIKTLIVKLFKDKF